MRFTFFGGYDPAYPRNAVLRKGLRRIGVEVAERRAGAAFKIWARYPLQGLEFLGRDAFRKRDVHGPDILFVPEFRAKDVPSAKLLSLLTARPLVFDPLAARYETKVVDWRRTRTDSPAAWWNGRIDAAAFRAADLILADTAAHGDYYRETYGLAADKIEVLPLGYDDDLFRPIEGDPRTDDAFRVLFFGSFLPLHGAEAVVEAARITAAGGRPVRFRLVGEGRTFPAVRALAAAHGLANIEFAGRLPLDRLPREIAAADVCLGIFGRTEKARRVVPHKIFQAMGMGKAVITSRTPAIEEFFSDGRNIVLGDEPFGPSLARSILELAGDPARRDRIARAGYDLVRREHTPEAVARRLRGLVASRAG